MKNFSEYNADDLAVFSERFYIDVHRQLFLAFERRRRTDNLTRTDLANALGVSKSVISRRLNGTGNLTLQVISDMARVMHFVPTIILRSYDDLVSQDANILDVHYLGSERTRITNNVAAGHSEVAQVFNTQSN